MQSGNQISIRMYNINMQQQLINMQLMINQATSSGKNAENFNKAWEEKNMQFCFLENFQVSK
jgi:hypothetical protein